jgi:hypothetical protein
VNGHSENEFARLIDALNPWLEEVVIIGGWAHRLYRLHPVAQAIAYAPIGTFDTDVAIPGELRVEGDDLRERLVANGFEEERPGQDKPPATHYRLRDAETGFYAEFLTPLFGGEHGRDGQPKATKRIAGVVSQQLRYLEVLLEDPWTVEIGRHNGFPFADSKRVRIANPVGFLAHKILIHTKRTRQKFAKDILYIHDTLETFGAQLEELKTEWNTKIKQRVHRKSIRMIERAGTGLFGEVSDEVRDAAQIDVARSLSPETVRERCNFGLRRIFGHQV